MTNTNAENVEFPVGTPVEILAEGYEGPGIVLGTDADGIQVEYPESIESNWFEPHELRKV